MGVRLQLLKPFPNLHINSRPSPLLNKKKITILLLSFLKRKQWTTFTLLCSQLPLNSRQPPLLHSTFVCEKKRKPTAVIFFPCNNQASNPYNIILLVFYKAKGRDSSCDSHGSSDRLGRGRSWRVLAVGMTDLKQEAIGSSMVAGLELLCMHREVQLARSRGWSCCW